MKGSLLWLAAGGCIRVGEVVDDVADVETYWVDHRFEGSLSFAEGEMSRDVSISAWLDWDLPDPADVQSDAFRVGLDGLTGSFSVLFFVDGAEVTDPARYVQFPGEGANLLGVFATCGDTRALCSPAATARITRAEGAADEALIVVEAMLSVDDLFGEEPPPEASGLDVEI